MELVSVARGNTLTSQTRTPNHQTTPRLATGLWGGVKEEEKKKRAHACSFHHSPSRHVCAILCVRIREGGRVGGRERYGTKKNSGVSREEKKD